MGWGLVCLTKIYMTSFLLGVPTINVCDRRIYLCDKSAEVEQVMESGLTAFGRGVQENKF